MSINIEETLTCDVCRGESGGTFVGVASLSTGPMSVAFCNKCLAERAEPAFALEYLYVFVAGGDIEALNPSVRRGLATWVDGDYIAFEDYVKRITPEEVKRQLDEYYGTMSSPGIVRARGTYETTAHD